MTFNFSDFVGYVFRPALFAAHKVHVVYFDQLLGAAHYIHFISNHDNKTLRNVNKKYVFKVWHFGFFISAISFRGLNPAGYCFLLP